MRTSIISIFITLLPATVAFVPVPSSNVILTKVHVTSKPEDGIDTEHAKYCADHFGECSLDDMENMRNALHQERVTHMFTNTDGLQNPQGLTEDIQHKLLENDLTLQMGLLQDKLATEHMQEDSMAAYSNAMNPYSGTMNLPILDGGLDEESSEALMICLAIAGLALLPQFV